MSRLRKQTVDRFLHDARRGKTIHVLQSRWGNDGYAFWYKLLEKLADSEGHVLDFSSGHEEEWQFLVAESLVSEGTCNDILDLLARINTIDKELWETGRIVWSQNFVNRLEPVYKKRYEDKPERPVVDGSNKKPVKAVEKKGEKKEIKSEFVLPGWCPEEVWQRYGKYRKEIGFELTDEGCKQNISKLEKLREQGNDPVDVINQTIECGWRGLFPLNNGRSKGKVESSGYSSYESERTGDVYLGPAPDGVE